MMTIWKFPLQLTDRQRITMPVNAKVLTAQWQHDGPKVWAIVDSSEALRSQREFAVIGTGNPAPDDINTFSYIATFQMYGGGLIFHVFERDL